MTTDKQEQGASVTKIDEHSESRGTISESQHTCLAGEDFMSGAP